MVICYKPLVHSHSLSCMAAIASSQDPLSWKGGCRDAKLNFSDRHHLVYSPLQILTEVADDFGARKMHLGHSFPKNLFSFLSVRFLILFIFSTIPFFLISFPPLRKRRTYTHKTTAGQEIKPLHKDDLVRCCLLTRLFCTDYFL